MQYLHNLLYFVVKYIILYYLPCYHTVMLLKISSPEKTIFHGDVSKVTLPSENGEITILPQHAPMVSVIRPGIVTIRPTERHTDTQSAFIFENETIKMTVSKGMIYVDGHSISVVTSAASSWLQKDIDALHSMKKDLQEKIAILKKKGSIEEIERSLIKLQKIQADIQLSQIAWKQSKVKVWK